MPLLKKQGLIRDSSGSLSLNHFFFGAKPGTEKKLDPLGMDPSRWDENRGSGQTPPEIWGKRHHMGVSPKWMVYNGKPLLKWDDFLPQHTRMHDDSTGAMRSGHFASLGAVFQGACAQGMQCSLHHTNHAQSRDVHAGHGSSRTLWTSTTGSFRRGCRNGFWSSFCLWRVWSVARPSSTTDGWKGPGANKPTAACG